MKRPWAVKRDQGNSVNALTISISSLANRLLWSAGRCWASGREAYGAAPLWFEVFSGLVLVDAILLTTGATAAQVPGEARAGILYTITHLHPVAYVILFIIFGLSVLNLVYQGYFARTRNALVTLINRRRAVYPEESPVEPITRPAQHPQPGDRDYPRRTAAAAPQQSVDRASGSARVVKRPAGSASPQPTPLDGINHTLPTFTPRSGNGAPLTDKSSEKASQGVEFRFTSAVEVPPPDEIQRRDRERLVVSGSVRGPDGKGLESVIVYLTDQQGNRLGQSCRSLPETGEFKVQVNAPGRYVLRGYKRGFVESGPEQSVLPVESGKIEGYSLQMIPEGGIWDGRIVPGPDLEDVADLEVSCVREDGTVAGTASTDPAGVFKIFGVPPDAACRVEVRNQRGELVHRSDPMEAAGRRELHRDLVISTVTPRSEHAQHSTDETSPPAAGYEEVARQSAPQTTGPAS